MENHPILEFWFGKISDAGEIAPELVKRWWTKSADFDTLCRDKFEADIKAAVLGEIEPGESARGGLAFILLCDQISRNIYRDTAGAFATDEIALAATMKIIESGTIDDLHPTEKAFVYMPLMHSEDREIQKISVERFTALKEEGYDTVSFAVRHKDIVDRFGRYPHRNDILSRESSAEEKEFLEQPGSSF
ncbi:MAG: DUF924 domain-containing protein [Kofleriaceae bacterium]|nr:DUF924 domain-containing protein [Kofleriaceae bacterium]